LDQLSLPVLRHFHKHWEECEEAGDYQWRRPGMMGEWVERWVERLLMWNSTTNDSDKKTVKDAAISSTSTNTNNIQILCDWPVQTIQKVKKEDPHTTFRVESRDGSVLHADWVVVTVPPMLWPEILGNLLTARKRTALPFIGFSRVVKVVCFFDKRLWPEGLQSLIVADNHSSLPIPEMWFRDDTVSVSGQGNSATNKASNSTNASTAPTETQYIMVGYLTSQRADDFVAEIQQIQHDDTNNHGRLSREDVSAALVMEQLAHMFPSNSRADCHAALRHTLLLDWRHDAPHIRGGYMHPIRGMTVQHLKDLAAREQRLLFAGEATNTNACCTMQAAMETGVRAAGEIWEDIMLQATDSSP
jgi:Flavin containing amine oxidoreductase